MPRYEIVSHFFSNGCWKEGRKVYYGTYEEAAKEASDIAHELDREFSDSHFWTVDLKSTREGGGSYFQLFHGRLS